MKEVRMAVEEAVRDYNRTMLGTNKEYLSTNNYQQKRGIFYNALRRCFVSRIGDFKFNDRITPDQIQCIFRENGTISSFTIDTTRLSSYGTIFGKERDVEIIKNFIKYNGEHFLETEINIDLSTIRNFKYSF